MEGSFHSATFAKTAAALIGYVTRSTAQACTEGGLTINQESLPWHIRYRGFTDTLPNITGYGLEVIGMKFTINSGGSVCTTATTASNPLIATSIIGTGGAITGKILDENAGIPLNSGFACEFSAGEIHMSGTARVTALGTTTAMTLRLI